MPIWVILIKIFAIVFGFVMLCGTLLTLVERKQSALIQNRVGPNRANIGPFRAAGLFHILADAVKTLFKEDIVPDGANKTLHFFAPLLGLFPAMVVFAVIPFMNSWCDGTITFNFALGATQAGYESCSGVQQPYFQIADIDAGLLYVFAILSLSVYGSAIGGWASNNKYSLLGALRSSAQMISYEVSMLLSLVGLIMVYGTIDLNVMVLEQGELLFGFLPKWGIFLQPVAFFLFLTAAIAETKRAPFDMPEAESELVAGYFTEYSSMKFAVFSLGEFIGVVTVGALMVTMFLGGWQVPFLYGDGFHFSSAATPDVALNQFVVAGMRVSAFIAKILFLCWFQLMIRWTLPRFRYDQVMTLGWKILLPLSLANLLVTGMVILAL
jgi:NADH-quinone oxidoreductase subunit H